MSGAEEAAEPASGCGVVALVGAPNAGKSTLLNNLVGAKVSIVTHKVQTTRARVRGIAIVGSTQIVFVDTPGIFAARRRLERAMVRAAWAEATEADVVVLLYDAARKAVDADTERIVDRLKAVRRPCVLALNKIDRIRREKLLGLAAWFDARSAFDRIFMISARTGDGVGDLRDYLARRMPEGPWLYPEDQLSDLPLRLMAAEVTREKLFLNLHQELPYALTVETEGWEEDDRVRIDQVIYVLRQSHKAMALGRGGRVIKAVRQAAERDLERQLGRPVELSIFVKVRERWLEEPQRYSALGLDFGK